MMPTKCKLTISPEMLKYLTESTNKSLEKYKKPKLPNVNWEDINIPFTPLNNLNETNH